MIDAAGAIYVIGGFGYPTNYKDVWVSTDGGARPDSCGCSLGTGWAITGIQGYYGVLEG